MGDEARRCKHCGNAVGRRCPGHLDACSTECLVALYDSALVDLLVERERTEDAETRGRLAGLREAAAEAESRGDRYERHAAIAEPISADDFRAKAVACHRVAAAIRKLIEGADDD